MYGALVAYQYGKTAIEFKETAYFYLTGSDLF